MKEQIRKRIIELQDEMGWLLNSYLIVENNPADANLTAKELHESNIYKSKRAQRDKLIELNDMIDECEHILGE